MSDRVAIITGTQAAKAFPALAKFLATGTTLSAEAAEQALRAACHDFGTAKEDADIKAGWQRAMSRVNGQEPAGRASTVQADVDPVKAGWAKAFANHAGQRS